MIFASILNKEMKKATIKQEVSFVGVGLHSGEFSRIVLHPDDGGSVRFLIKGEMIPAHYQYVVNTNHSTDLGKNGVVVKTVEHLMAVLYILGIDSLVVEFLEGFEVPAMDGSGYYFYKSLKDLVYEIDQDKEFLKIEKPISVKNCTAKIDVLPGKGFLVEYIGSVEGALKDHRVKFRGNAKDIVFARTFCYDYQVEALKSMGLARGGSLKNAVVLTKEGKPYNQEGLRCKDEPIRHKLLDLIGDLSLLGKRLKGKVVSHYGGHSLNYQLVKALSEL
jgi:UDP-3-O-[3-hydroxymyristoyl] N-acetylglucosamine deacetylase